MYILIADQYKLIIDQQAKLNQWDKQFELNQNM